MGIIAIGDIHGCPLSLDALLEKVAPTAVSEPVNRPHLINIDTGCCFFTHPHLGHLTAVRLPERHFISVPFMG